MSSVEQIIDAFILKHELDENDVKEPIINLVNKCIEGIFKHIFQETIPETVSKPKTQKVLKADKIEDPSTVENRDDLNNCTTGVLNQFCKDNNIKVGGNKPLLIDRVWRFLQGETSDDDKSSRGKLKTAKKSATPHQCSGCNAKGQPCGVSGTEERNEKWYCWRHITEITINEPEPEITPAKPVIETKKPKSKKPKAKPVELVSDEE